MTPLQNYQHQLIEKGFHADPQQECAIRHLQRVHDELLALPKISRRSWLQLKSKFRRRKHQVGVRGVYLWGEVGAGKTWLMDLFYQSLINVKKLRLHFHQFMQQVHRELKHLQGHTNPLQQVARQLAQQARVICLDEFLVTDIADAMILANLLEALFAENITLVTTANTEPDGLYRRGIQRQRFLPAIALIKSNLETVHVRSQKDYRQQAPALTTVYFYPLNKETEQQMQAVFAQQTSGAPIHASTVNLHNRPVSTVALYDGVVWFDFQHLCAPPRSQLDYLEIVQHFHTVFLSNIPAIKPDQHNTTRYLINLIDILYDAKVKLVASAAAPITDIYPSGLLAAEFQRTCSRLVEMQSQKYLGLSNL